MSDKKKQLSKDNNLSRRQFIRRAGATAAAFTMAGTSASRLVAKTPGANERIGVGIIGVGHRGTTGHLKALHWLKTNKEPVEIAAVCDIYRPRMERSAKGYGAKGYMDHRELLDDPNVDVVCIASGNHHHSHHVLDAVKAGKDVYCEKPWAHWRQFELAKSVAAEVKKSGCVFQLGTQGMSDSAWRQIKDMIQKGKIGQPIHAECGWFRDDDYASGMVIEDPNVKPGPDLNWEAFLGDAPKRPFDVNRFFRWHMYEDYAGGPGTDLFAHSLMPVAYMLGVKMPDTVVALGGHFCHKGREVPDTYNMIINYPKKVSVTVLGTMGNKYQGTGLRGTGNRVPIIRGTDGALTTAHYGTEEIIYIPRAASILDPLKEAERFPIDRPQDLLDHWKNFLTCCRTRNPNTFSPMELAYPVQTTLQMGILSSRAGKVAHFDAKQEKITL